MVDDAIAAGEDPPEAVDSMCAEISGWVETRGAVWAAEGMVNPAGADAGERPMSVDAEEDPVAVARAARAARMQAARDKARVAAEASVSVIEGVPSVGGGGSMSRSTSGMGGEVATVAAPAAEVGVVKVKKEKAVVVGSSGPAAVAPSRELVRGPTDVDFEPACTRCLRREVPCFGTAGGACRACHAVKVGCSKYERPAGA
jgi:hypothetical protein